MKIIIIGGVAAGTKTAAKLKRENQNAEVTILTNSAEISYAGCGLPYYVGNVIKDKSQLIVNTPESFEKLTGARVKTKTEVIKINREAKSVDAKDLLSGEITVYHYDKLVIATGARPVKPKIDGIDLEGVHYMRTPEDAIKLRESLDSDSIKRAVVAGGGFIGLEVAENLALKGVKVSVIDMADHILPGFDPEFAEYAENHLADRGIITFTGTRLESILGEDKVEKIQTDKRAMKTDAVIISVGIRANTEFLDGSGLELMPDKTIKVDSKMQTNDKNIYAVGDCACVAYLMTKNPTWSPMGSSANIEGRIAAKNINGKGKAYNGVLGTAICKLPELNVGRTGLTEDTAKKAGFDSVSVTCVVDDKAHYYPDASNFIIKTVADKNTKKLLGLQVMGKGSVDKIVDIAVTAITLNASLEDLENMDLAYAPPFSTAIHPFSHAVNILLNKINGELESLTPKQYANGEAKEYKVIDVSVHPYVDDADYIELTQVNGVLSQYSTDDKLLLVCTKGKRAYMLQNRLKHFGYKNTLVLEAGTTFNNVNDK